METQFDVFFTVMQIAEISRDFVSDLLQNIEQLTFDCIIGPISGLQKMYSI